MIDLKNIQKSGEEIKIKLAKRGFDFKLDFVLDFTNKIKILKTEIDTLNHQRKNNRIPEVGQKINLKIEVLAMDLEHHEDVLKTYTDTIPNIAADDVTVGIDDADNLVIREVTHNVPTGPFEHLEIQSDDIDTQAGTMLAGARFAVLRKTAAKLHRKIINEALDFYGNKYEEVYVPNLVLPNIMYGTGQYPKFKNDLFTTGKHYLVPTGEVPVTNLYRETIQSNLKNHPIRLMTHTPCFREEVGAAGKDQKGLMRQHQFEKVELVKICHPEDAYNEFLEMLNDVETFIAQFGIDYRIVELCTGDMGFAGHKAYDFEMFFAQEGRYREIASITWCHDFQARRMNLKCLDAENKKIYAHTINGTGLAAGRILEAITQWKTHHVA